MKKNKQEKINLKKLTIARINPVSMGEIKGGSSILTSEARLIDGEMIHCLNEQL